MSDRSLDQLDRSIDGSIERSDARLVEIEPVTPSHSLPAEPVREAILTGDRPPPADWREFLLPLLLLAMALAVVGVSWHKTRIENPAPAIQSPQPIPDLSPVARIAEARSLGESADKLWEEGYRGLNDHVILRESRGKYRQAWELVTGRVWPNGTQSLVIESPEARSLRDRFEIRISTLDQSIDGSWWPQR